MPNGATSQKSATLLTFFQIKRRKKKRTYLLEDNDNGNDITATATFANVNDDDRQKKRLPCLKEDIVFPVIICKLDLAS